MKYLITLILLVSTNAFSQDKLADANRKILEQSTEIALLKHQLEDALARPTVETTALPPAQPITPKQNRVTLYGGAGPDGIKVVQDRSGASTSENIGALIGLGYSRVMSGDWSLSGMVSRGTSGPGTTYTGLFGFGYDF